MDQNVIGRSVIPYHRPSIKNDIMRIFVRDLTADSEGNATAIGNADFTTKRLVQKIDHRATYMNAKLFWWMAVWSLWDPTRKGNSTAA